uniref:Glycosyltransferase family 92 protein n=1 Tax=Parascaris univalens TaxID=6257 RepID=A0A915BIS1_PARUN
MRILSVYFLALIFLTVIILIILLSKKENIDSILNDRRFHYFNDAIEISSRILLYKAYCVLPNVLQSKMSKNLSNYERITLVIHISSDYLDERLIAQANAWDGPISLSIVVPPNNFTTAINEAKAKIFDYAPFIETKLSAHFIYRNIDGCTGKSTATDQQFDRLYPINVARNVARLLSWTKYILIADYEYIFSEGFEARMLDLATTILDENPKTALVFRIFEANGTINEMPRTKRTLYDAYKRGDAIEFHDKYVNGAHSIPGLKDWFERNVTNPSLSTTLSYKRHNWEPQFVALSTIPFHDENFPYPIRDNTELRWEMCRLNYTFQLVDDLFMVHPGIKKKVGALSELKKIAWKSFHSALQQFNRRMDICCQKTKSICPRFRA